MKKITYLLGAGASANAIPVVAGLKERFKLFLEIIKNTRNDISVETLNEFKEICLKFDSHYSPDTYAKKLFLQNPNIHTNSEYHKFKDYLTTYLLFEQLSKTNFDIEKLFIHIEKNGEYINDNRQHFNRINLDLDYRYDAFWATILRNDGTGVKIPDEINIISWNYDIQVEKSYMNFTGLTFDDTVEKLNIVGLKQEIPENDLQFSKLIKLNGSAVIFKNERFDDLFDFQNHKLDESAFDIIYDSLKQRRTEIKNCLRFAWENDTIKTQARERARNIIRNSDIIIVIGYSFPYFNREVDQYILQDVSTEMGRQSVYLQLLEKDYKDVIFRLRSVRNGIEPIPFLQTDQFYIPF